MKYAVIKNFGDEKFRRLTRVKRSAFEQMIAILIKAEADKKTSIGKPNSLPMEDRLLMTLEYLREYRTYFHIAASLVH